MKEKIILTGEINEEEKNAWFEICNFFALPAREIAGDFEGFGIVYLEANLHGKAVLAGRSGGVEDAVRDGVSGLLVNPKDTEAIAQASLRLMQDKKLCEQMGEEGKKRALRDFNWQGQVEKIKKAYQQNNNQNHEINLVIFSDSKKHLGVFCRLKHCYIKSNIIKI